MITVISGIRELAEESEGFVEIETLEELEAADEIRVGGALGVDTTAAASLCGGEEAKLVVYVPFSIDDQPHEAAEVARNCADEIVELHLRRSKSAYLERNARMLVGADHLLAFTDGRDTGGTAWTIRHAQKLGIPTTILEVASSGGGQVSFDGVVESEDLPAPVFFLKKYASRRTGYDKLTKAVLRQKHGEATSSETEWMARLLADFIFQTPGLERAKAIVPMPRRTPGVASDLDFLARLVADMTGKEYVGDWLLRKKSPTGGTVRAFRTRNSPEQHFMSLALAGEVSFRSVILLDNISSFGGTMSGAMHRILADSGVAPVGLTILKGAS